MHIDELLDSIKPDISDPYVYSNLSIPESWSQGRTVYGGLSTALMYAAIKQSLNHDGLVRSLNCNFVAPLLVGEAFSIKVTLLRQGKSVTQMNADLIQNEQVCAVCQVCFGMARESKIKVKNTHYHGMPLPEKVKFIPQIPKVVPKFLKHFEFNLQEGKFAFAGSDKSHLYGWVRYKTSPKQFSDTHLIAILDAWPPTVLQMPRMPIMASTISWSLEFIHPHQAPEPSDWLAFKDETRHAFGGYSHTDANIWNAQGELVAMSRQTIAIFG